MRLAGQSGGGFTRRRRRRRRRRSRRIRIRRRSSKRSQVGGRMGRHRRQKGGLLPIGMLGPAIGMAGSAIKVGKYMGKKLFKKNKKKNA